MTLAAAAALDRSLVNTRHHVTGHVSRCPSCRLYTTKLFGELSNDTSWTLQELRERGLVCLTTPVLFGPASISQILFLKKNKKTRMSLFLFQSLVQQHCVFCLPVTPQWMKRVAITCAKFIPTTSLLFYLTASSMFVLHWTDSIHFNFLWVLFAIFSSVFGRPFVKRFALSYQTVFCLSVCPVCDVGVLWPNGWMDQDETWHTDRPRPRPHCFRWGLSSPPQKGTAPSFRLIFVMVKWLDGLRCYLEWR